MAAYEYTALDASGRELRGVLEGDSARQIRQLLRDQSLLPVTVGEVSDKPKRPVRFRSHSATASGPPISRS